MVYMDFHAPRTPRGAVDLALPWFVVEGKAVDGNIERSLACGPPRQGMNLGIFFLGAFDGSRDLVNIHPSIQAWKWSVCAA